MSLIKDVKTILQNSKITDTIYLSFMPDMDNCIALFTTGGKGRDKADKIEEPTFQILLRNLDYEAGTELLEKIKDILDKQSEIVVNNNRYLAFYQQSDILFLERDENERYLFSLNFRCYVERKVRVKYPIYPQDYPIRDDILQYSLTKNLNYMGHNFELYEIKKYEGVSSLGRWGLKVDGKIIEGNTKLDNADIRISYATFPQDGVEPFFCFVKNIVLGQEVVYLQAISKSYGTYRTQYVIQFNQQN